VLPRARQNLCHRSIQRSRIGHAQSYIGYYQAKMIPKGSQTAGAQISADLLAKVCDGIGKSDEVEPWFRDKYNSLTEPPKKAGRILRREE
jgi:hypothetical protein